MNQIFDRINSERRELLLKLNKLELFIGTEEYHKLDDYDKSMLDVQILSMKTYFQCLCIRLQKISLVLFPEEIYK
jgi:hypothetical protein